MIARDSEDISGSVARGGRQLGGAGLSPESVTGECKTTGYETRIRQDCEVVTDTVCSNLTITKYKKKIEKNCTTRVSTIVNQETSCLHFCSVTR